MQRYGCMECGWDGAKQSRFGLLHDFIPQQVLSEPPPSTSHLQKTTLTTDNTPSTTPTQTKRLPFSLKFYHNTFVQYCPPSTERTCTKHSRRSCFPIKTSDEKEGGLVWCVLENLKKLGQKGRLPPSTDWQLTRALISPVDLQFFNDGDDDQLFDHYDISDEVWCKHINFVSSWISFSIVS